MTTVKVLRVFANQEGQYGNPVGIVVDSERKYDDLNRRHISAATGFSETVFINSLSDRSISIYNPENEIPFAGHAVVGVVFFLEEYLKKPVKQVTGLNGPIEAWSASSLTWVKTELRNTPPWNYEQLPNAADVEKVSMKEASVKEHTFVWAWINKDDGVVRARTFASDWGIPEDEANGSGCMKLAAELGKSLTIYHGKGSIIYARSTSSGWAEVGGLVTKANDLILS